MSTRPTPVRPTPPRFAGPACDPLERRRLFAAVTLVAPIPALSYTFVNTAVTAPVRDAAGNLYLADPQGGPSDVGTLLEVAPATGTVTTLYTFDGSTGAEPIALAIDAAGDLFGLASYSIATAPPTANTAGPSASGPGVLFEVTAGDRSAATVLYAFSDPTVGQDPTALVVDPAGNVDVLTTYAGPGGTDDGGTLLQFAPATAYATPTLLAALPTTRFVYSDQLALGTDGSLYVSSGSSGSDGSGPGALYKLVPGGSTVSTLATFDPATTGSEPSGLYVDSAGDLFGTAESGRGTANSYGDVWEYAAATGTLASVAGFADTTHADGTVTSPAGFYPLGGVAPDGSGDLLGVTSQGSNGNGTVFSANPATGAITYLATFTSTGTTGYGPETGLVPAGSGNFYGVTESGGANGRGAVFELNPSAASPTPTPTPTPTPSPTPTGTATLTPTVAKSTLATSVITGTKAKRGSVFVSLTDGGTANSTGTDTVALYATTTGAVDAASTLIGSVQRKLTVRAGHSVTVAVPVASLQLTDGAYTVLAQVTDAAGTAAVSATGPAIAVAPATVTLDVAIGAVSPTALAAGKPLAVTVTVTNSGNTDALGPLTVTLGLSADGGATLAVPFAPVKKGGTVKANGRAVAVHLKVKTPATVPPGTYLPVVTVTSRTGYTASTVGTTPVTFG